MNELLHQHHLAMFHGGYGAERHPTGYVRRDDGSHIYHNAPEYYEWWYFDAAFSNGYHVVVTFHYRNIFLKPMVPSIQLFVYLPDGTKIERYQLVSPENASASPDCCDVRMAESWVRERDGCYQLHMAIKNLAADLTFRNTVPPWKPGTGFNYRDEDQGLTAGWVVPVPHAEVSGTLTLKDRTIEVQGAGYHDHNWGNYHCHRTFRSWYWGRVHHDAYTVDYAQVLPRNEAAPPLTPLLVARDGEIVLSTNQMTFECLNETEDEALGQRFARRFELTARTDWIQFQMTLNTRRVIDRAKLPRVTDRDHYYYRFLADYRIEVDIDGVSERVEGELLHELMLL